jgi:hypothetical protein
VPLAQVCRRNPARIGCFNSLHRSGRLRLHNHSRLLIGLLGGNQRQLRSSTLRNRRRSGMAAADLLLLHLPRQQPESSQDQQRS